VAFAPVAFRSGDRAAATEELADHPTTARSIYAAEAALGQLIATRHTPEAE